MSRLTSHLKWFWLKKHEYIIRVTLKQTSMKMDDGPIRDLHMFVDVPIKLCRTTVYFIAVIIVIMDILQYFQLSLI